MPYKNLEDLPDSVRDNLPQHAQEIYKEAYNSAWEEYADPSSRRDGASREELAHRVAWAAVKKKYEKDGQGEWKPPTLERTGRTGRLRSRFRQNPDREGGVRPKIPDADWIHEPHEQGQEKGDSNE